MTLRLMTLDTMVNDAMSLFCRHKKCLKQNKKNGSVRDYILKYLSKWEAKRKKRKKSPSRSKMAGMT